jgi:hypothetical protein
MVGLLAGGTRVMVVVVVVVTRSTLTVGQASSRLDSSTTKASAR